MNVLGELVACLIFPALETEQAKQVILYSRSVRAGCDVKNRSPQLQEGSGKWITSWLWLGGSQVAQIPSGSGTLIVICQPRCWQETVYWCQCPSDTIAEFLRCALLSWSKRTWHLKCEAAILYLEGCEQLPIICNLGEKENPALLGSWPVLVIR